MVTPDNTVPDFAKPDAAVMKPILFFDEFAEEPQVAYSNKSAMMQHVPLKGGFVKSLDPENFPFDAEIRTGADEITFRSDNPSVGHLDCRMFLTFNNDPEQTGYIWYSGIVQMKTKIASIVGNEGLKTMNFTDDGYVTCNPDFFLSDNLKAESWVKDKNFLAKGRFLRDDNGTLKVQYWVYIME